MVFPDGYEGRQDERTTDFLLNIIHHSTTLLIGTQSHLFPYWAGREQWAAIQALMALALKQSGFDKAIMPQLH